MTFVEPLKIQDNEINITYTGKISGDEIKFTRKVGDFGSSEATAKREGGATKTAAVDFTGTWKSEFNTQIGVQKYSYVLKQEGTQNQREGPFGNR